MTHVVATSAFAGVERYVTYVAPALSRRGLDVTVLGGERAAMSKALRGSSVEWRPAPNLAAATLQCSRERRADVVHAHMTDAEMAVVVGTAGSGGQIVATRHFAQHRGSSTAARLIGRRVAKRIDRQIAISEFVAANVEDASVVIPNAVPDAPFGAHDRRLVVVAQRLEAEKDTATAIRAWAGSGLGDDGWRLVIAGRGQEQRELQRLCDDLKVSATVDFAGFVTDLGALMADASMLLAPAAREPFGLAVAEAMACGLPIVAAAAGAHLETVGRVTPHSLFVVGDADAAAGLLRQLAFDPERRAAEGPRLRAHQQAEMGLDPHVDRLLDVYNATEARR